MHVLLQRELSTLVEGLQHGLSEQLWGLVLFGSVARGEAKEGSDLDLLLVADGLPEKFTARMRHLRCLLPSALRGGVSFIAKTRAEFEAGFPSYYLDLALDGIILCDREDYMQQADPYSRITEDRRVKTAAHR
jgi:predicted nucleotidyltransferase